MKKHFLQCGLDYLVTKQSSFPSSWHGQNYLTPVEHWFGCGCWLHINLVVTWCRSEEDVQVDALESRATGDRVKAAFGVSGFWH